MITPKLLAEILFNLFQKGLTYDDLIRQAVREITVRDEAIREDTEKEFETKHKGFARPIEDFDDRTLNQKVLPNSGVLPEWLLREVGKRIDDPEKITED